MLPLIPYNGILRPTLLIVAIYLSIVLLRKTRRNGCYKKGVLFVSTIYIALLLYATFLTRNVAKTPSYRLEFLGSISRAFSIEGGICSLIHSDLSTIELEAPQSLEGIVLNLLLMVPLGYLLPLVLGLYKVEIGAWRTILIGSLSSATIEITQLITHMGMLEIDDWFFNSIGTAVGYFLYRTLFIRR